MIDLEELRQKRAAEELEEERTSEGTSVTTAFLIVQQPNGQWAALAEYKSLDLDPERTATLDDIIGGTSAVYAGATSQQTAMATVIMMTQQAQQMQQQMATQRIASQIDPSKLRAN